MGSLIEEYRRRHNIQCVWPMNEGLLFFEHKGKPSLIATTSSFTKSHVVCAACPKNTESITLEIFRRYSYPICMQRVTHTHMPPDADLVEYIRNHVPKGEEYTPYVSKGERDQERWLWEFFVATGVFDEYPTWKRFITRNKPDWLEQAFWTVNNLPEQFKQFYQNVYSLCMIGRRYILLD